MAPIVIILSILGAVIIIGIVLFFVLRKPSKAYSVTMFGYIMEPITFKGLVKAIHNSLNTKDFINLFIFYESLPFEDVQYKINKEPVEGFGPMEIFTQVWKKYLYIYSNPRKSSKHCGFIIDKARYEQVYLSSWSFNTRATDDMCCMKIVLYDKVLNDNITLVAIQTAGTSTAKEADLINFFVFDEDAFIDQYDGPPGEDAYNFILPQDFVRPNRDVLKVSDLVIYGGILPSTGNIATYNKVQYNHAENANRFMILSYVDNLNFEVEPRFQDDVARLYYTKFTFLPIHKERGISGT